jgi:hypothetical protein
MTKTLNTLLPKNAYIHIDKIHMKGPCRHTPIGKVYFGHHEDFGFVAAGSRLTKKQLKRGADSAFVKSKKIEDDGLAYELEIHCCPPKVLQKHNVFGHSSLVDYAYAVFDHVVKAFDLDVDLHDREEWRAGRFWLTEVHLTGNFGCLSRDVVPIIDAIDDNNSEGKHRDLQTCITLGFTGKRRSKFQMATLYYKPDELMTEWKKQGPFQKRLIEATKDSIRGEMKFYSMGLKALSLQYGANWMSVDVATLFFSALEKHKIKYAIQPLLTAEALAELSTAELNVYQLWLHGKAVSKQFRSRSSERKYIKAVKEKTGFDMSGNRRPDPLPTINLADVYSPANVLPIPDWLFATEHYFPPKQLDLPRRHFKNGIGSAPLDPKAGLDDEGAFA